MASSLKGTQRENHKYLRREEKNGKYVYVYEEPNTGNLIDTGRLNSSPSSGSAKAPTTSSWVTAYNRIKNSKASGAHIEAGKSAARKLGLVDKSTYRAKLTNQVEQSQYDDTMKELRKQADDRITKKEEHYRSLLEQDKKAYSDKLQSQLADRYKGDIPKEELSKIDKQTEQYADRLWKNTYEPMLTRDRDGIEKQYESVDKYLKARVKK